MNSSSNADGPLLEVGRIEKVHGLRGEVQVGLLTNMVAARTAAGTELYADGEPLVIETARRHRSKWLIRFEGIGDRTAAEGLRGRTLTAPPLDADAAATGEPGSMATEVVAFVHELIGSNVVDQHGVDHGPVTAVIDNPAADILELESGQLVPLSFYSSHDGSTVHVDVPAGLLDGAALEEAD